MLKNKKIAVEPLPTVMELASIAAFLSTPKMYGDMQALPFEKDLAEQALRLWFACKNRLTIASEEMANPVKKLDLDFPISLDRALNIWMPNAKLKDRRRTWQHYRDHMREFYESRPFGYIKFFADLDKDKLGRAKFESLSRQFPKFMDNRIREIRSQSGKKGAAKKKKRR